MRTLGKCLTAVTHIGGRVRSVTDSRDIHPRSLHLRDQATPNPAGPTVGTHYDDTSHFEHSTGEYKRQRTHKKKLGSKTDMCGPHLSVLSLMFDIFNLNSVAVTVMKAISAPLCQHGSNTIFRTSTVLSEEERARHLRLQSGCRHIDLR